MAGLYVNFLENNQKIEIILCFWYRFTIMASLIFKTKDLKYTMLEYADESSVLKTLGVFHQTYPTYIAGLIYKDEYREPPVKITKEDGKTTWKAKVVNNQVFLDILKPTGRTGTWIVFYGAPHLANNALCSIGSPLTSVISNVWTFSPP